MMSGKKGLVVGVANEHSIAWGCAKTLYEAGAGLALTYLNDKSRAYVEPLAKDVKAPIFMPLDVTNAEQFVTLFAEIKQRWGRLDFLLHSIAFAPKADLQGRVTDSSGAGFATAMGYFLPFPHPSREGGGAADDPRRIDFNDELLRIGKSRPPFTASWAR